MGTDDLYSPELPEPIIQRIQSLLPRKKSAETALLSKSWDTAWSTRPTIDLDESCFPRNLSPSSFDHHSSSSYGDIDGLVKYAKKTFRRYEESNLKINTFRLCVNEEWYGHSGLAAKWTLKALKLGATNLTLRLGTSFPFPELSASQNVVRLCLKNTFNYLPTVVRCRGLKSLTLSHVYITSDMLLNLISCCPLIENMSISHTDIYSAYGNIDGDVVEDQHEHGLKKLTSLVMCLVGYKIQQFLLGGLSSKFPNLKELTLKLSSCRREIQVISSHSLEILNYSDGSKKMQRVEFDIPGICKFTFEGENMPKLSFRSTMDQWESRVSLTLTCDDIGINAKWFFELSRFLTRFRLSKIHLCLHLHKRDRPQWEKSNRENNDYKEGEIEGLYPHQVEDVTINNKCLPSLGFNALLDGLFRICRPKMISQYVSTPDDNDDEMPDDDKMWDDDGWNNTIKKDIGGLNTRDNDMFLCAALEQVMKVTSLLLPTNFRHGLTDLDEVIAQKLIDEVWKPQPVGSILDDSTSEQRRFRFLLKWKPSLNQYNSDDDFDDI